MADLELAALSKQCPGHRLGTMEELQQEVESWQRERNEAQVKARWQFTTADARVKLKGALSDNRAAMNH